MITMGRKRAMRHGYSWLRAIGVSALTLGFSAPAGATLGESSASIECNRAKLQARLQVQRRSKYAVHELALPAGGKVRQFVADGGKVFAVSWSGGWRPDLRELLGVHYERYLAATKSPRAARGPVRIELPGLVVVLGGHQRAFFGHVYLSDQMPANTRPEEIR